MKYLTIDDVCDMFSISRRTLERMRPDTRSGALAKLPPTLANRFSVDPSDILERTNPQGKKMNFPEPDLYIGKSPRWDRDKLIAWLEENGRYL
ncbi:helix-turn-helix domain-containing protein [Vibrio cyclitrophicus]|uniref:DNA-binding protein n=1 Tax=Vibrio cyclitrophicus TaxID=47951 RepID=UPI001055FBFF|nr:DNA-binding protein [Vibrio cyclitrophicus]NOH45842.1 helix-turn-helix domain-containing protein [Vibrio cyclitrophicus]